MPINGLMVTLSADEALADDAHEAIRQCDQVECGQRDQRWLPLAADTADDRAARDLHGWLESLPGVDQVGVILVGFDEPEPSPS